MSGSIARDPSAATQLVYPWPLPLGTEHEIACADDEQAVVCPAWTVGETFGAGRRLWRSPDPSKPTSIYFVLTSSVEVPFDAISSFMVPMTQQGITLRATGTIAVRCREPAMLVAQFVGLPFDDLDGGIKRSVARSVERMLARLLTRRVVIAGSPQAIVDPAVIPQIGEELTLYNPTAGAVFGVELVRIVDLEIGVHDGVHSWTSRTQAAQRPSSPVPADPPAERPTPPPTRRGNHETHQRHVGDSGIVSGTIDSTSMMRGINQGSDQVDRGEQLHATSARHRTLQGAAAVALIEGQAAAAAAQGGVPTLPSMPVLSRSIMGGGGPRPGGGAVTAFGRAVSPAVVESDDEHGEPIPAGPPTLIREDPLDGRPTIEDMSAQRPSLPGGHLTGAYDMAAAHGFLKTGAYAVGPAAVTPQDLPVVLAGVPGPVDVPVPVPVPVPPVARPRRVSEAFAIGAAIGMGAIGVSDAEEVVPAVFTVGQRVMMAEADGRLQSAVIRQQKHDFCEIEVGSTGALLWMPSTRLLPE